jgi:2-methylcitrate dehydratase PrpD
VSEVLRAVEPLAVDDVVVRVAHQGANTVDNRAMPDICMQHMCAVILIDGRVTFESAHDEARMRDRKVLALRRVIELRGDDGLSAVMPSRQGIVELSLRDGRKLKHHTRAVRGTAENRMTRAEVDEKSFDLMAPIIGKARARRLCDAVWKLEKIRDVRTLRPLFRA